MVRRSSSPTKAISSVPATPSSLRSTRFHRRRSWYRGHCCRRSRMYIAFPAGLPSQTPLLELHGLAAATKAAVTALGDDELRVALRTDVALSSLVSQFSRSPKSIQVLTIVARRYGPFNFAHATATRCYCGMNRTRKLASPRGMPSNRMAAECSPGACTGIRNVLIHRWNKIPSSH